MRTAATNAVTAACRDHLHRLEGTGQRFAGGLRLRDRPFRGPALPRYLTDKIS
ncbi:MAG: hypothetical protein AAGA68_02270 [Pseudomonadota bacterium]